MDKITLPTKTKIAAWWMMIWGGIFFTAVPFILILIVHDLFRGGGISTAIALGFDVFLLILFLILGFSFYIPGRSLLKGRRWAWKFAIIMLLVGGISSSYFTVYSLWFGTTPQLRTSMDIMLLGVILGIILFFFLVPFLFLILDRKNFWKIAS